MTSHLAVTCGLLLASASSLGAATIEAICAKTVCRKATVVKQPIDERSYQEFTIPKSPYVFEGMVNIVSGETIHIKVVQKAGSIVGLEYSEKPADIRVDFKVEREPRIMSVLVVKNNLDKAIVYRAGINAFQGGWQYESTSTCPVQSKLFSYETWPYSIAQPLLKDFRFAGPDDTSCKVY